MRKLIVFTFLLGSACTRSHVIGEAPEMTDRVTGQEYMAMISPGMPTHLDTVPVVASADASLWTRSRGSLLGERRAQDQGDILTVVIEINDGAEITNSSGRSRSGSEQMSVGALFGLPQRAAEAMPAGASLDPGVSLSSASEARGQGSVSRNEKLTLRVAATVTGVLPNGVLVIEGHQEIRVNYELRDLMVSGFVRPEDVSRLNEVTYDKIASARISYGGRGEISEMQQPRYGQQLMDAILPF